MNTTITELVARLRDLAKHRHLDRSTPALCSSAADALQQQAERITAQDVKCRLYEASLAKADAEIDGLREIINSPDAMASARAANALLTAEIDGLKRDAERYRWLREQHWNEADIAVVCYPKKSVKLGFDCPSGQRLDEAIDAAIAALSQSKGEPK